MPKRKTAQYRMVGDTIVGFFYSEVILHYLDNFEFGRRTTQIVLACGMRYDTTLYNLKALEQMNRIKKVMRLVKPSNRIITHWVSNKWSIDHAKKRIFRRRKTEDETETG